MSQKEILRERYTEQVINDRVTDLELRKIYRLMTKILEEDFNGIAKFSRRLHQQSKRMWLCWVEILF